jgi:hypothetical protein
VAREPNPIRWERDVSPATWLGGLGRSGDRVDGLVPAGFEAYARLVHPLRPHVGPGLPPEERVVLVDALRSETATPRCWFCVDDERREIDDQAVKERVEVASTGARYLLHTGPIELALVSPPQKPLPFVLREGATVEEMAKEVEEKLSGYCDVMFGISADATPAQLMEALAGLLEGVSPAFWWPEDRAWFVATAWPYFLDATYVGGSRGLVDRLIATPALAASETTLTESLGVRESLQQHRGPEP